MLANERDIRRSPSAAKFLAPIVFARLSAIA